MPSRIFPGRLNRPDWNNLDCPSRNDLPQHAYLIQYPDQLSCEAAVSNNRRYLSPYVLLMNGSWDYKRFESITQLPENIFAYRSGFEQITVPGCYDVGGLLNKQPLKGVDWPFVIRPPFIPEDIPVGVYHRSVQFPPDWTNLRKRLVVTGAASAYHVVVNGRLAGYAQQGMMTREYDVSSLVHDGINELFILVYPFSAASYLDPQPSSYQSGLAGDLYFEAIAPVSVFDLAVDTQKSTDQDDAWTLAVDVKAISYRVAHDQLSVQILLKKDQLTLLQADLPLDTFADASGASGLLPTQLPEPFDKSVQRVLSGSFQAELEHVMSWSAETPELYDLYVTVIDQKGSIFSCVHQAVGFSQWAKTRKGYRLNGQDVKLWGVRYDVPAELFPSQGTLAGHVRELRKIKQLQLNTVILNSLPMDPLFFELCNHLGLYVITDNRWPLSARNLLGQPEDTFSGLDNQQLDPRWLKISRNRLLEQIHRDQNQPCLLIRLSDTLPSTLFDSKKAIAFGQLVESPETINPNHELLSILDLTQIDKEIFLNRLGSSIRQISNQSVVQGLICGRWHDFSADTSEFSHPASSLLKEALSPLEIEPYQSLQGLIRVRSKQQFTDLENYRLHWQVLRNGLMFEAGEVDGPTLEPQGTCEVSLPLGPIQFSDGAAYHLVIAARQIAATISHPADALIYRWYDAITADRSGDPYLTVLRPLTANPTQRLKLEQDRHLLVISGPRFWIVFNKISGMLESWRCGDLEWLSFAQTTQTAHRGSFGSPLVFTKPHGASNINKLLSCVIQTVESVEHSCDGNTAVISVCAWYGHIGFRPQVKAITVYEVSDKGEMTIRVEIKEIGSLLPSDIERLGYRLFLRKQYHRLIWNGYGPEPAWPTENHLNYPGQFVQTLASLTQKCQKSLLLDLPHAQTRWVAAADGKGQGLLIENQNQFSFQAFESTLEDRILQKQDIKSTLQNPMELILDWYQKENETIADSMQAILSPATFRLTPMLGFIPEMK